MLNILLSTCDCCYVNPCKPYGDTISIVFSGISISGCFESSFGNWVVVTSLTLSSAILSVDTPQAGNTWGVIIENAGTYKVYSDEDCSIPSGEEQNFDVFIGASCEPDGTFRVEAGESEFLATPIFAGGGDPSSISNTETGPPFSGGTASISP